MINQELLHEEFDLDANGNLVRKKVKPNVVIGSYSTCKDRDGYIVIGLNGKIYRAHRLVWMYVYGSFPEKDIDHINGIKDDNRPENLRLATRSQNKQNQHKQRNNRTGFKGIWKNPQSNSYIAQISHEGKKYYIGCFKTPEEAHNAYCKKENELHEFKPSSTGLS